MVTEPVARGHVMAATGGSAASTTSSTSTNHSLHGAANPLLRSIGIILCLVFILPSFSYFAAWLLRRRRRRTLLRLRSQQRRYRHLEAQTRVVTAAFRESMKKGVAVRRGDLRAIAEAGRRDGGVWVVLRPNVEFTGLGLAEDEAGDGGHGGGAGPVGMGQRRWVKGRKSFKKIEKRLRLRDEISEFLEALHADLLARTFEHENSQPERAASATASGQSAESMSVGSIGTLATSSSQETLLGKAVDFDVSEFVRQTKFDFEDGAVAESGWSEFEFGFGDVGRQSLRLRREGEETKKSWFEWVSLHLK